MEGKLLVGEEVVLSDTPFIREMIDLCRIRADKVFMVDAKTNHQVTFGEFLTCAGTVSCFLRGLKQKQGKIITIVADFAIDPITFIFGTWISGAATSCINPSLPTDEIVSLIKTCRSEVIYCGIDYVDKVMQAVEKVPWAIKIISPNGRSPLVDYYECFKSDSEQGLQIENYWTGKDHQLAILFTSGTTGTPKGVVLRDEAFKIFITLQDFGSESSFILQTSPLYWVSNAMGISLTIFTGSKMIIAYKMSVEELLNTIRIFKPTSWFTGPAILIEMCQLNNLDQYDTSSLKKVAIGGTILLPEHRRLIIEKLFGNKNIIEVMYGSTEAGIVTHDRGMIDMNSPQFASMGKVARGVTIKIVDPNNGQIQPPYITGELCAKSPGVLKQYINKAITEDELDKDGFWHMGDLAYYDENEFVYYSSRLKDVMKYKGQQISPVELEMIIQRHPDIIESCVVGRPCVEKGGDLPTAFIVKKHDSTITEQEIYDFVAENVIDEKKLRGGVYFVNSLPKSAVGKPLRYVLQMKVSSGNI